MTSLAIPGGLSGEGRRVAYSESQWLVPNFPLRCRQPGSLGPVAREPPAGQSDRPCVVSRGDSSCSGPAQRGLPQVQRIAGASDSRPAAGLPATTPAPCPARRCSPSCRPASSGNTTSCVPCRESKATMEVRNRLSPPPGERISRDQGLPLPTPANTVCSSASYTMLFHTVPPPPSFHYCPFQVLAANSISDARRGARGRPAP